MTIPKAKLNAYQKGYIVNEVFRHISSGLKCPNCLDSDVIIGAISEKNQKDAIVCCNCGIRIAISLKVAIRPTKPFAEKNK